MINPPLGFYGKHLQHRQVWIPVYEYMKKHGYNVTLDLSKSGYVLSSSEYVKGSKNISFQHGLLRGEGFLPESFGVLAPGPYWLRCFTSSNGPFKDYGMPKNRVKMVGWPKSDLLFSPEKEKVKAQIENKLNLPYDQTVLVAMSISDCLNIDEWYTYSTRKRHKGILQHVKNLIDLTRRLELNVLFRPHELSDRFMLNDAFKQAHVRWIESGEIPDVTKLFLVSDIVVACHTSIATEAMVADLPVISYDPGYVLADFSFSRDEFPALNGSWGMIEEHIKRSLEQPDEFKELREKWIQKQIFKADGNATKRSVDAILELIREA